MSCFFIPRVFTLGRGEIPIVGYTGGTPPERGAFFELAVYKRVGKIAILVYESAGFEIYGRKCAVWVLFVPNKVTWITQASFKVWFISMFVLSIERGLRPLGVMAHMLNHFTEVRFQISF